MDWKYIKEKYSKAFKLLESQKNFVKVLSRQNIRLLYDFFDENDVYIRIIPQMLAKKVEKGYNVRDRFMFGECGTPNGENTIIAWKITNQTTSHHQE